MTSSQLQDVVTQAVEKAIQPLKDEVAELAARVEAHSRKIYHEEAQPLQRDRGDILRALLAANDGKMLRQEARRKMHMEENRFSELLKTQKEYIETRPSKLKPREKLLLLK